MDQGLQEIAAAGAQIALTDYLTAVRRRAELGAAMRRFHETYDLLLTPTLPLAAFEAGQERPDPVHQPRWINWAPFSNPFNLTQQPAASVPCGLTTAGLPVGLQIVGPMHADALVLRAARSFESSASLAAAGDAAPLRSDRPASRSSLQGTLLGPNRRTI